MFAFSLAVLGAQDGKASAGVYTAEQATKGEALYKEVCAACHGDNLEGQGSFPSLHGVAGGPVSDNLQQLGTDYPDTWANLWIDGTGPEVRGIDRFGMPQFGGAGGQLTTEEIATIVDFLKTLE